VNSATICNGNNTSLTASGATTYSWNTGATTASISVSPSITTTYSVSGTTGSCSNVKTTVVNVNPNPIVTSASSSSLICVGQSATITAGGANTYSWSTGGNTTAIVVSPTISTTYTVIGTDLNNCNGSSAYTQSVSTCTNLKTFTTNDNINVFPNPNNGTFNVEINVKGEFELEAYNMVGQLVYKGKLNSGSNKIDIKTKAGVYYYSVIENNKTIHQGKLVIE
jgi:hypothetical protein